MQATDKAMRELEGATPVHVRLKACQWQLDCATDYASSRLQVLRWQHAAAAAVAPRYVPRMPAFRELADPESSILKMVSSRLQQSAWPGTSVARSGIALL